jgi:hypothetical protein
MCQCPRTRKYATLIQLSDDEKSGMAERIKPDRTNPPYVNLILEGSKELGLMIGAHWHNVTHRITTHKTNIKNISNLKIMRIAQMA